MLNKAPWAQVRCFILPPESKFGFRRWQLGDHVNVTLFWGI